MTDNLDRLDVPGLAECQADLRQVEAELVAAVRERDELLRMIEGAHHETYPQHPYLRLCEYKSCGYKALRAALHREDGA